MGVLGNGLAWFSSSRVQVLEYDQRRSSDECVRVLSKSARDFLRSFNKPFQAVLTDATSDLLVFFCDLSQFPPIVDFGKQPILLFSVVHCLALNTKRTDDVLRLPTGDPSHLPPSLA